MPVEQQIPKPPGTREQQRAQLAFARVSAVESEDWAKDYGRQCLHLPALIHQCGLCQALAFVDSKGADGQKKPYYHRLLEDLATVMKFGGGRQALTTAARGTGLAEYQRLSREALKSAQWLKRYAEAVLKAQAGGDEGGA
jgi:CRISPR-associated protein Cmr5